jgi:hypothetical protein
MAAPKKNRDGRISNGQAISEISPRIELAVIKADQQTR